MGLVVIILAILTAIVAVIYLVQIKLSHNSARLIVGYWEPMECNSFHLEFTKYGTIVQWAGGDSNEELSRERYAVRGKRLYIGHLPDLYGIRITVSGKNNYLEIYGDEKYAGKYRKK